MIFRLYIGKQTWYQLDKDVRTARGIARRLREITTDDVDRVVRFLVVFQFLRWQVNSQPRYCMSASLGR
jgi:hypothetical protein